MRPNNIMPLRFYSSSKEQRIIINLKYKKPEKTKKLSKLEQLLFEKDADGMPYIYVPLVLMPMIWLPMRSPSSLFSFDSRSRPSFSSNMGSSWCSNYATPLIRDEFEYSKTRELVNGATYNPSDLRGYFTHGIHNNLETLIDIMTDKCILPRSHKTSTVNTLTGESCIDTGMISLSTITTKYGVYTIYGKMGITFITNKLDESNVYSMRANMPNEFFTSELKVSDMALLLDEKLKSIKIKDLPLLHKLNEGNRDYKNVIRRKILFLIGKYQVEDTKLIKKIVSETDDVTILKEFYFVIIGKIFWDMTLLEFITVLLDENGIDIPIVFLNYPVFKK